MFEFIIIAYISPAILLPIIIFKIIRGDFKKDMASLYQLRKYSIVYFVLSVGLWIPAMIAVMVISQDSYHILYHGVPLLSPVFALLSTIISAVAVPIYAKKHKEQ